MVLKKKVHEFYGGLLKGSGISVHRPLKKANIPEGMTLEKFFELEDHKLVHRDVLINVKKALKMVNREGLYNEFEERANIGLAGAFQEFRNKRELSRKLREKLGLK